MAYHLYTPTQIKYFIPSGSSTFNHKCLKTKHSALEQKQVHSHQAIKPWVGYIYPGNQKITSLTHFFHNIQPKRRLRTAC